jgi:bacterioferritin (cytochrome b1)
MSAAHWSEEETGAAMGHKQSELEPEDLWLRYRLRRLRAILRRVKEPTAAALLRELISDAEERLELLEKMKVQGMLK